MTAAADRTPQQQQQQQPEVGGVQQRLEQRQRQKGAEGTAAEAAERASTVAGEVARFEAAAGELRAALAAALAPGGAGVEAAVESYRAMQRLLHEASAALPPWDRQRANEQLAAALREIEARRAADGAAAGPAAASPAAGQGGGAKKKGFAFSRRAKPQQQQQQQQQEQQEAAAGPPAPAPERTLEGGSPIDGQSRISGRSGARVMVPPSPSMFLSDLRDCEVFIEPVDGSVFIERCTGCTFVAAAQQFRIHNTTCSSFYLHCPSEPIIEDCDTCGFAPFLWDWPDREAVFAQTALRGSENKWGAVNDFKWIRAQSSPHWFVIPERERRRWTGREEPREEPQEESPAAG